ncbi:MAG TPA: hypothetical protein DEF47_11255 [Herpetosiphon sp.]|nr:hypothetical protein [Herpetosiphon sp.]HBW50471.1 hypothetical protein [Herpetosiphon sp.]
MALSFVMNIPDEEYPTISSIASLTDEEFAFLIESITQTPVRYHPRSFAAAVSEKFKYPHIDAERIIRTIISLYGVKSQIPTSTDKLVPSIINAFVQRNPEISDAVIQNLGQRLERLLTLYSPLGIVASAYKVASDSERCIVDTHTFLDLRPIFNDDNQELLSNVILYRLKLTYENNDEQKDINFTFDIYDVLKLRYQLDLLIEKSNNLQEKLESVNIHILDSNPS